MASSGSADTTAATPANAPDTGPATTTAVRRSPLPIATIADPDPGFNLITVYDLWYSWRKKSIADPATRLNADPEPNP